MEAGPYRRSHRYIPPVRNERLDADGTLVALEVDPATETDRHEAETAGLALVREVLQLRCALPLPSEDAPAVTRSFVPGADDESFLEVNNRAFSWHPDQSGWTIEHLRSRCAEEWFDADGFLLHESDGRLDGYCWTKVHPANGEDPAMGEIFVIGVDPDAHGRGLGRALTIAGLSYLSSLGLRVGMLHVEHDNERARRLYESLGFTIHSRHCWWSSLGDRATS